MPVYRKRVIFYNGRAKIAREKIFTLLTFGETIRVLHGIEYPTVGRAFNAIIGDIVLFSRRSYDVESVRKRYFVEYGRDVFTLHFFISKKRTKAILVK